MDGVEELMREAINSLQRGAGLLLVDVQNDFCPPGGAKE
jgi:hypothetical protein